MRSDPSSFSYNYSFLLHFNEIRGSSALVTDVLAFLYVLLNFTVVNSMIHQWFSTLPFLMFQLYFTKCFSSGLPNVWVLTNWIAYWMFKRWFRAAPFLMGLLYSWCMFLNGMKNTDYFNYYYCSVLYMPKSIVKDLECWMFQ